MSTVLRDTQLRNRRELSRSENLKAVLYLINYSENKIIDAWVRYLD